MPLAFFDQLASRYDAAWTNTLVGRMQRNAVWRQLDPLVNPNDRILDLGCGTGEDALHFSQLGAMVLGIDGSSRMVEVACGKGVDARSLGIEQVGELTGTYDMVLSNFGALNCVRDLAELSEPLARLIRHGGLLAICVMNRFCLWESVYYAVRGRFKKASRRWSGETETSTGLQVFYPSARKIEGILSAHFRLLADVGIGVCVPPSFVRISSSGMLDRLDRFDFRIARSRIGRAIGDHRLLLFVR